VTGRRRGAGTPPSSGAIDKTTEEEMDSLYNVHFKGVFFLTQKFLPLINDGGRIVTASSGLTRIIILGSTSYASMKGAIAVLIRYLAKDWGRAGSPSTSSLRALLPPVSAPAWFAIIRMDQRFRW
jgi:NAD(P)-dependent dehydrogenase (short-subunit alcohol dehydrogenase family)